MGAEERGDGARRRRWARPAALALAVLLPVVLIAGGCGGGGRDPDDEEEERPVSAPPRLATENGQTVIVLDPATLSRSGIAVEALTAATHAASSTAYGSVLDLTDLAVLRGSFAAARSRVDKGRAALAASQAEFERLRTLYADGQNASQRALQAAAATARSDEVEVRAAESALEAQRALARQRWGVVVAGWLDDTAAPLAALLEDKERLLEITLPPGSAPPAPQAVVAVQAAAGPIVVARVVSAAPRSDPRIQGATFLCTVPASPGMLPGVTVVGQVPVGPSSAGVLVPASAVVWWQGRAWVYVEKGAGTFGRIEVATGAPVPGGWFVSAGLAVGDRVVVRGAQTLLSEEGRGGVHGSEG
jgi:hypothetical protein